MPNVDVRCENKTPETCGPNGQWVKGADCAHVCNNGICSGECDPPARQCDRDVPQQCDANGLWVSEAACALGCMGMGVCNQPPADAGRD
jgi:hypothetical protein